MKAKATSKSKTPPAPPVRQRGPGGQFAKAAAAPGAATIHPFTGGKRGHLHTSTGGKRT